MSEELMPFQRKDGTPARKPKSQKGRKKARVFYVDGVNVGDGRMSRMKVRIDSERVTMRRVRGRIHWSLKLPFAVGVLVRRAQIVSAEEW